MKIDDVELTLFNWDNIPPTRYHAGSRNTGGQSNLGLLTIEALKARRVPIHGIAFVGEAVPDSEAIIAALSGAKRLGRLPHLDPLTPEALAAAFAANFDLTDFQ